VPVCAYVLRDSTPQASGQPGRGRIGGSQAESRNLRPSNLQRPGRLECLVVIGRSTAQLGVTGQATTDISGSSKRDLFCDGTSLITGKANAPSAVNVDCGSLHDGGYPPIP
jgi:hypothetical protein